MKNKFFKYIRLYNEVIESAQYRDTQIAKVNGGMKSIVDYKIENINFYNLFLDKVLNVLNTFPMGRDLAADSNSLKDPSSGFKDKDVRREIANDGRYEDNEDDYDEEDDDYYDEEDDEDEDNYEEAYQPFADKALEHEFRSISSYDLNNIQEMKELVLKIKDDDFKNNAIIDYISNKEFKELLKKKNYNSNFYKYIYCGIINYLSKNHYFGRLLEIRGRGFLWLRSNIKESIFTPVSRDFMEKINKKNKQMMLLKIIVPDFDKLEPKEIIKKLETFNKRKNEKNINDILKEIKTNGENFYSMQELTTSESRQAVVKLFNKIKKRFLSDAFLRNNFQSIGTKKLVFDYNTGKPASLTNQVFTDTEELKMLLQKMKYHFNDFEFELGKVEKDGQTYSFKDLVSILKQEMTEIKSFSSNKELELKKLAQELSLETEIVLPNIENVLNNKIKENESLQIEELKKILSYDNKVDKKIGDLIKEALTIDKTKTNDILKQYNKTKLNRLLVLIKEKEAFEKNDNKISKEDYEKVVHILSSPHILTSNQKMKIIFTLSPRAFISQSTRANLTNNIKSCMNVFYGSNRKFIPTSLMDGSFTAWLVKVNKDKDGNNIVDSKIIDPLARVIIKPFRSKDNLIFWAPDKSYASDARYENLSDKVFDILSFQMEELPEDEKFELNKKVNYQDTVKEIQNDIFNKTINNTELLAKAIQKIDKEKSEKLINYLFDNKKQEVVFDKFSNSNLKNKIKIHNLSLDYPTDTTIIPNNFEMNSLHIGNHSIKKISDDVKIKELYLKHMSELKSIDNMKYIKDIEKMTIDNENFVFSKNLSNSTKLKRLDATNTNFKNIDLNLPRAEIHLLRCKNMPEKIKCSVLESSDTDFRKTKEIDVKILDLNSTINNDKIVKDYGQFVLLYETLHSNLDLYMMLSAIKGFVQKHSNSEKERINTQNLFDYLNKKNEHLPMYKNDIGVLISKKTIARLEREYDKLSEKEKETLTNFLCSDLYEHFYGKIIIDFTLDKPNKYFSFYFSKNSHYETSELTHAKEIMSDKDFFKSLIDYLKNFKFNFFDFKKVKNAEAIEIRISNYFTGLLDLTHIKNLRKFSYKNDEKNVEFVLPESVEEIDINCDINKIKNIKNLKNLLNISVNATEKELPLEKEMLMNLYNLSFYNGKTTFHLKYLYYYKFYKLALNYIINDISNDIKHIFDKLDKKEIEKYIADEDLENKFKNFKTDNYSFIERTNIFTIDDSNIKEEINNLNNTEYKKLILKVKKNINLLKDKTVFINEADVNNFYDFYLDVKKSNREIDYYNDAKMTINIVDNTGNIDLTKLISRVKDLPLNIKIITTHASPKIKCDTYYELEIKNKKIDALNLFHSFGLKNKRLINNHETIDLNIDETNYTKTIDLDSMFETKHHISINDYSEKLLIYFSLDCKLLSDFIIKKYFKSIKKINDEIERSIRFKLNQIIKPMIFKYDKMAENIEVKLIMLGTDISESIVKNFIYKEVEKILFKNVKDEYDSNDIKELKEELKKI